jgi:hypothetical protein
VIIARFIIAIAILFLAAYVAVMNWGCVIVSSRNRRRGIDRYHSTVPLFSFLLTVPAIVVYPWPGEAAWMLAVPLLDIGNWVLVFAPIGLIALLIRGWRAKNSAKQTQGRRNG